MVNPCTLIDALGGTSKVAELFEVKPPSVSEWRKSGIPKARLQTLRLLRPDLFITTEGAPPIPATEVRDAA